MQIHTREKASVNVHRKSLSLAVKLDVCQHKVCKFLDLLGSNIQVILKSNDKMQEIREIEMPSRALKLNRTVRTSTHLSAVSTEIRLM